MKVECVCWLVCMSVGVHVGWCVCRLVCISVGVYVGWCVCRLERERREEEGRTGCGFENENPPSRSGWNQYVLSLAREDGQLTPGSGFSQNNIRSATTFCTLPNGEKAQ